MNRLALLVALAIGHAASAQPLTYRPRTLWLAAMDAKAELEACDKLAGSLVGDVVVDTRWKASPSKSLGTQGRAIARCVRDALKKHHKKRRGEAADSYTMTFGTPTRVLPPIATFMPVWRAALAPHATKAERDAFAKLVPADYKIKSRCIVTDRAYAAALEQAWLGGATPITTWDMILDKLVGYPAWDASWDGTGLVTRSEKGLCAETFDPVASRKVFDGEGSCWAGTATDILLAPRIEFPKGAYTQVATRAGRTCAVTTSGAVTCCGRIDPTVGAPPPAALRQITLGDDFTCGLDDGGKATCWGRVKTAPSAPFLKLSAGPYHVCGIHLDRSVECWPDGPSPQGSFVDIALAEGACGIHTDGTIDCWERGLPGVRPGRWQTLAIAGEGDHATICGLRGDQTIGCTHTDHTDDGEPMTTPLPQKWTRLAVATRFGVCGLRLDGSISCSDLQPAWIEPAGTPPPSGTFTDITADRSQFCAIGKAGTIACWGAPWPLDRHRDHAAPAPTTVHGTIVDEHNRPIENATVTIEEDRSKPPLISKSARDGTWSSSTKQNSLWATFTAPGREVVDLYGQRAAFTRPVVLRPASTLQVTATCDGKPCPAQLGSGHYFKPTTLEHMPPGNYRFPVWSAHGTPNERLAIIEVEMPFAAKPQHVTVELKATGAGHTIRGSVTTTTTKTVAGLRVELRCANDTLRQVETDAQGTFELRNVPPLPCALDVSGLDSYANQMKITSYADVKVTVR